MFRQHLQHGPQVQPPLLLRHSVPERNTHNIAVKITNILHTTLEKQYVYNSMRYCLQSSPQKKIQFSVKKYTVRSVVWLYTTRFGKCRTSFGLFQNQKKFTYWVQYTQTHTHTVVCYFVNEAFLQSCYILFNEGMIINVWHHQIIIHSILHMVRHVTLTQSLCVLWAPWRDWMTSLSSSCRSHRPYQERSQTHGLKAHRIDHLKSFIESFK